MPMYFLIILYKILYMNKIMYIIGLLKVKKVISAPSSSKCCRAE